MKLFRTFLIASYILLISLFISCGDDPTDPNPEKPVIASISPEHAKVKVPIIITGSNFGAERGTSSVEFGGIKALDTDFNSWSDKSIVVKVPEAGRTGNITVTVNNNKSNEIYFIIDPEEPDDSPQIISVDSTTASVGSTINIRGKNFGKIKDTNYVTFNGVRALSYGNWSDSIITLVVPQAATSGKIVVTVYGKQSNGIDFIVRGTAPAGDPKIDSLSTYSANQGQKITIFGSNFGATQGTSYVQFGGGKNANYYQSWSGTKIVVEVPANSTSGKIIIYVSGKPSNGIDFTVNSGTQDPQITNLDIQIAQPGQTISINGKNFGATQGTNYVDFNGAKAVTYKSWSDTKIQVNVPDNATTGNVYVWVNSKKSNGISFTVQAINKIVPEVLITAGNFNMGSESGDGYDTKPVHQITISKDFYMSQTEISQKQWKNVMNQSNPSKIKNDNNPVEQVTFLRACEFCNDLSALEGKKLCYTINGEDVTCDFSANGYRLPTEAEWEYAARAGKSAEYSSAEIINLGWVSENSDSYIHEVKGKPANAFGLYDMFGNVNEMVWDYYDAEYYGKSVSTDPKGPSSGAGERVMRGGSYINGSDYCNAYKRETYPSTNDNSNYNLGFRVVRLKQ